MSVVSDPNANTVVDVTRILSEVQESPSVSRQLLVDQVTDAIVQAHLTTTVNTYASVAEANERIQREIHEMPDCYSHSVNANNLWQHFIAAMLPEITKVINFCTKLPGFPEVALEDKIHLIKQGCFEVMVTRFCILVDHVKEEMFDPTLMMKAPRHIVQDTPMGEFLDQFFTVASQFNPLGLTDGEIGLFTAVLMLCPDREGLMNRSTVNVIQQLFLQSLYLLLKQNHSDADQTLSTLINMVPTLHKINEDHLKFLKMIKMKSPTEFEKKFPPLHKELFDSTH
uniref:NR LBD domain-containing protein n=1 Tax=Arion vulgaris TaxID=1028688 RepID=A0A0B7BFJ7_9EUPU